MSKLYLGIDPGSAKSGAALVENNNKIIAVRVILMQDFITDLQNFLKEYLQTRELAAVIVGNGTTSEAMQELLCGILPKVKMHVIDEAHSTEEARTLYWKLHPPRGLRRLLPLGIQTPPVSLDGYAAAVLVQRYIIS